MQKFFLTSVVTLLLICFSFQSYTKTDTTTAQQTVNVGALLSLTGNWSSLGITSKAALEITTVYDTKLDTALAKQFIEKVKDSGVNFVIGPQSSAEVGTIKQFADANNILVVSQGSTAGSLSIANDNISLQFSPT